MATPTDLEAPAIAARRIYNPDFLDRLGQQFKFNGKDPEIAAAIMRMGISYLILRRMENRNDFAELNKPYKKLAREINKFRVALENDAELDLPQIMYFSALELNEPAPAGDFPGLTDHERRQSGEPYFQELLRLLNILAKGISEDMQQSAPKRGPRANQALESLAFKAGEFFAQELNGRPFTIDPHKPFKPTRAFDFIKTLIVPLNKAVTDNEIVTAIRIAKSKLRPPKK